MDADVPARASVAPRVVALLIAGVAVLALGLWLGDRPLGSRDGVPELAVEQPAAGDTVRGEVRIHFRTTARLTKAPEGWRTGRLHLHAVVDGLEVMPGADDVRALGDGRYEWRMARLRAGEHELALRWSAPDHRPVDEGASEIIPFVVVE